MQLRAQQNLQGKRENGQNLSQAAQMKIQELQGRLVKEKTGREGLQAQINTLQSDMAKSTAGSNARSKQLVAQMQELQLMAGLTPVQGSGVIVTMTDSPTAAAAGGGSPFLPGIVHDFDLLQVVNELRSAKAEAIAIQGADRAPMRVTGFTPIRCVGPVIYVSGEPIAAPFKIYAIGSPDSLASALKMPDGIVDKLSSLFPVKVRESNDLKLPAVESAPKMRVAKVAKAN
jgi:uncharacterized protein YlxW (UPF0749 family)